MSYSKRAVTYSFVVFLGLFTTPQLETPRLFKPAQSYSGGGAGGAVELAAGDVNGDAKVDLVVADSCLSVADCSVGGVGILLGNGDGTFQNVQTFGSGGYQADSVAVGDVNGDGKLDVLVANQCLRVVSDCTQGVVGVLLGSGDGTFQVTGSLLGRL
jgi:FG-GAP-like repeat